MTKANANAAANAQEQQAAQQQILRDLLALGKKNGRLTLKEISDALSHLELSSEDIDKVYETLETMGIEVETNGVLEKVIGDDDDSFEPEEVEEVPEEELVDTSAMAETGCLHGKALCRPRHAVPRSDPGGQPRSDQGS